MKKELLLSSLILTSPIAHITAQAASEIRASVIELVKKGEKKVLVSKPIGNTTNQLRVTLEKGGTWVKEPNRIKPEMHGRVELIDGRTGEVISTLAAEEGDYLFDLVHSDEYSDKYVILPCSSSMRCTHAGNMTLEFVKDQSQVTLILPSSEVLVQPEQMMWVDLF